MAIQQAAGSSSANASTSATSLSTGPSNVIIEPDNQETHVDRTGRTPT